MSIWSSFEGCVFYPLHKRISVQKIWLEICPDESCFTTSENFVLNGIVKVAFTCSVCADGMQMAQMMEQFHRRLRELCKGDQNSRYTLSATITWR